MSYLDVQLEGEKGSRCGPEKLRTWLPTLRGQEVLRARSDSQRGWLASHPRQQRRKQRSQLALLHYEVNHKIKSVAAWEG